MKKTINISTSLLSICLITMLFLTPTIKTSATSIYLSSDEQWIVGLSSNYEYITEKAYTDNNASNSNNPLWTKLSGGNRPDGTQYSSRPLTENNKLEVASAWYGQNVYFRQKGTTGIGTKIAIPSYESLKVQYKSAIRIFNAYEEIDTGKMYGSYLRFITDSNDYLIGADQKTHITIDEMKITTFNKYAKEMLTDAEGNYIYDLVAIGPYTGKEPNISGYASHTLLDYLNNGYGFLIGHDTFYGYSGVSPDPNYVPNPNDKSTTYYTGGDNKGIGHYNMNWLIGANEYYTSAKPYEANSLILPITDYTNKSTMYGDSETIVNASQLRITGETTGNPLINTADRTPVNYPYSKQKDGKIFNKSTVISAGVTHTNQQISYGKIWIEFASNSITDIGLGVLVEDNNSGFFGSNNFYLSTNGNIGINQIGHINDNIASAYENEARILANTVMYLSQREPCLVCSSHQHNHNHTFAVKRISSAEELALIGNANYNFTYPLNGCYILSNDIVIPSDWKPIENFTGHFNADGHTVTTSVPVFKQSGILNNNINGWNLGTNQKVGNPSISVSSKNKTTGIARVSGYLYNLFDTKSNVNYINYKIILTGSDGKEYDCIVTREGKYVLSNLPVTTDKMIAKVYDNNGKEITKYGEIFALLTTDMWNNNQTVPLQLSEPTVEPLINNTIYRDENLSVEAVINVDKIPTKITWQYLSTKGWKNISSNGAFVSTLDTATIKTDKDNNKYCSSKINFTAYPYDIEKTNLRVIFEVDGKEYSTFDVRTDGYEGELNLLDRPYKVSDIQNINNWEGEKASLTSTLSYYKTVNTGVKVEWFFRGGYGLSWEKVDNKYIITNTNINNTTSSNSDKQYKNNTTSKLNFNMLSSDYDGYQFKVVFTDISTGKKMESNVSTLDVYVKNIKTTKQPTNIKATTNSTTVSGTYTYTADFEYYAPSPNISTQWEFRKNGVSAYQTINNYDLGSYSVKTTTPVSLGNNKYKVTATLTLTNPKSTIDSGNNHYYFRVKGSLDSRVSIYSSSADFTLNYTVDLKPNTPQKTYTPTNTVYMYPELTVTSALPIYEFIVTVNQSHINKDVTMSVPSLISNVTPLAGNKGYYFKTSTAPISAAEVQRFLRTISITTKVTTDIPIEWSFSTQKYSGIYEPYSGKYFEFVPSDKITFTQSYANARSLYNNELEVYGQLATIKSSQQQALAKQLLNGKTAWFGLTNDKAYNGGSTSYKWIDGTSISYSNAISYPNVSNQYGLFQADGKWKLQGNVSKQTVTATNLGRFPIEEPWQQSFGTYKNWHSEMLPGNPYSAHVIWHPTYYPETNFGFRHCFAVQQDSKIVADVNLINGHTYWIRNYYGGFGDNNGYGIFRSPLFYTEIPDNAPSSIGGNNLGLITDSKIIKYTGTSGIKEFSYESKYTGSSCLFEMIVVDLTETFTNKGVNIPTTEWLDTNLGFFDNPKSVTITSNSSEANGYLVEYSVNNSAPDNTTNSARTTTLVKHAYNVYPQRPMDMDYRPDTDVIFATNVKAFRPVTPDAPATITFKVINNGSVEYLRQTITAIPNETECRAFVSYHIPDRVGDIVVEISSNDEKVS